MGDGARGGFWEAVSPLGVQRAPFLTHTSPQLHCGFLQITQAGGKTAEHFSSAGQVMATRVVPPAGTGQGACQVRVRCLGGTFSLFSSCSLAPLSLQQHMQDQGKEVSQLPWLHTKRVPLCSQHVPLFPQLVPFMCSQTARCKAPNQHGPVSPREPSSLRKSPCWGSQPTASRGPCGRGQCSHLKALCPGPSFEVQQLFGRAELSHLRLRLTRAQGRVSL